MPLWLVIGPFPVKHIYIYSLPILPDDVIRFRLSIRPANGRTPIGAILWNRLTSQGDAGGFRCAAQLNSYSLTPDAGLPIIQLG